MYGEFIIKYYVGNYCDYVFYLYDIFLVINSLVLGVREWKISILLDDFIVCRFSSL